MHEELLEDGLDELLEADPEDLELESGDDDEDLWDEDLDAEVHDLDFDPEDDFIDLDEDDFSLEESQLGILGGILEEMDFSGEEITKYIELMHEQYEQKLGKRSFGSAYGGLVCWGGSINCSSCYGPLIATSGICKNA